MLKCLTVLSAQPTRICGQKRTGWRGERGYRPPAPARPAAAHLRLTAGAPAQGAHRLLAPRLSRRREVRRLFALKVHPCETRASVAPATRAGDLPTSRRPVLPPTFQDPSLGADPHMVPSRPGSGHTGARKPTAALPAQRARHRRSVRVTGARTGIRTNAVSGYCNTKPKCRDVCGDLESKLTNFHLEWISSLVDRDAGWSQP